MPKRKPKTEEPVSFPQRYMVVAADLSLKRPGFARFQVDWADDQASISHLTTFSIDNKTKTKPHGEILREIQTGIAGFCEGIPPAMPVFYVREKAINSRAAMSEIGIFKVVGVTDLFLWETKREQWHEIYPVTVKKNVTGSGKADKDQVAKALASYLGEHAYSNDDESDAAAVGVAFLIQHGQLKPPETKDKTPSSQDKTS